MPAAAPLRQRHRQLIWSTLRWSAQLLGVAATMLAVSLGLLFHGYEDAALAAAVSTAIAAVVGFAVLVNLPLSLVAELWIYFSPESDNLLRPAASFGRVMYRESARLDALAEQAGLTPLSAFESADPLDSRQRPRWHLPAAALSTVDYLLTAVAETDPVRPHLAYLQRALIEAERQGARFYLLLTTWAGGTNGRVEAYRREDPSMWPDPR